MKFMKVFKRQIALSMIAEGFQLIDKEKNYIKPHLNVYIFEETEESLLAFQRIQKQIVHN